MSKYFIDGTICPECKEDANTMCVCSYGVLGVKKVDDGRFYLANGNSKTETLECKCGSKEFHVGKGDYFTAIQCSECGLEVCVHEG